MTSEEIKAAMYAFAPVRYQGRTYSRITAYIFRVVETDHLGTYKTVFQVELLDRNLNSVTIAPADKVELKENHGLEDANVPR